MKTQCTGCIYLHWSSIRSSYICTYPYQLNESDSDKYIESNSGIPYSSNCPMEKSKIFE